MAVHADDSRSTTSLKPDRLHRFANSSHRAFDLDQHLYTSSIWTLMSTSFDAFQVQPSTHLHPAFYHLPIHSQPPN